MRKTLVLGLIFVVGLVAVGCSGDAAAPDNTPKPTEGTEVDGSKGKPQAAPELGLNPNAGPLNEAGQKSGGN